MAVNVRGDGPRKWPLQTPRLRRRDSAVYGRTFEPGSTPPPMMHPTALVALDELPERALPAGVTRLARRERVAGFTRPTRHDVAEPLDLAPADLAEAI